jgi:hypothetical protein
MTPETPQQTLPQIGTSPTPPPVFASDPQGRKPKAKSTTATFLGSAAMPTQQQAPQKTLLGA